VPDQAALDAHAATLRTTLLQNSPTAIASAKALISRIAGRGTVPEVLADTAATLASQRASTEGREGLSAFFAKRKPAWAK
jgi:methylglutaconyl-CoA hydratase